VAGRPTAPSAQRRHCQPHHGAGALHSFWGGSGMPQAGTVSLNCCVLVGKGVLTARDPEFCWVVVCQWAAEEASPHYQVVTAS
jgi:hypothetical protein